MKNKLCLIGIPLLLSSLAGCSPQQGSIKITGANEWGVHGVTTYKSSVEKVSWSSSDENVASISSNGKLEGLSAGKTTITASKKGYKSASMEVTIVYNPFNPSIEDMGVYYGLFNGVNSRLDVQQTVVGVYTGDLVKAYYPTEFKRETFSYVGSVENPETGEYEESTLEESYDVLYFSNKFNDGEYRLKFTESEFKFLSFEKKSGRDFLPLNYYFPLFDKYVGTYNGEGYFSEYNRVFSLSCEPMILEDTIVGYPVDMYEEGLDIYSPNVIANITGFYTNRDEQGHISYDEGFLMLDLTDGEFYEGVFGLKDNSLDIYMLDSASELPYWYNDPTLFFTSIVNEQGVQMNNAYEYDSETESYNFTIAGEPAEVEVSRDTFGLKYEITSGGYEYILRTEKDFFVIGFADQTMYYSPAFTALEQVEDVEQAFEDGKGENAFVYYLEYDWDTEEYTSISKYNGVDVDVTVKATKKGPAAVTFELEEGKEARFIKLAEAICVFEYEDTSEYYFGRNYLRQSFNFELFDGLYNYEMSATDHTFTGDYGQGEQVQPLEFVVNDQFRCIAAKVGEIDFVGLDINEDDSNDLFLAVTTNSYFVLLTKDKYNDLEGTYTSDGVDSIRFDGDDLYFLGTKVAFSFSVNDAGSIFALFSAGGVDYALGLFFDHTLGLYQVNGQSLVPLRLYVDKSITDLLVGDYYYYAEGKGTEHIAFTQDFEFWADVWDDEHDVWVPTQFPWSLEVQGSVVILNMITQVPVPFTYIGHGLALDTGANGLLVYLDPALYAAQGVYASADKKKVVSFMDNKIYVAIKGEEAILTTQVSILSITYSEGVYTIEGSDGYTFEITVNTEFVVTNFEVNNVEFTAVGTELYNALKNGEEFTYEHDETTTLLHFSRELTSGSINHMFRESTGGGFGFPGAYFFFDGEVLKAFIKFIGTNYEAYIDGEGHRIVTVYTNS